MARYPVYSRLWLVLFWILIPSLQNLVCAQENSVTIGSDNLKESAVLWLQGNGTQGFLLPAVNATADVITSDLQAGTIVYQTSDNKIYWYNGSSWIEIGSGSGTGGNVNKYTLELEGNNLILTENGTNEMTVPVAAGATINNRQVLTWDGSKWVGAFVDKLQGFDLPAITTLQSQAEEKILTFNPTSSPPRWELKVLSSGSGNMSTATYDADTDGIVDNSADAGLLNGQIPGYYLDRSNHTGTQDVSTITGLVDNDAGNEIQSLSFDGANLTLSGDPNNAAGIDITGINTDNQQLSYDAAGQVLSLENGGSVTLNVDSDATNELQSLSFDGNYLFLSDDASNPTGIDLSPINTDNQTAAQVSYDPAVSGLAATNVKAAIDELAAAPDSDNQSLSYDGTTQNLSLTNGGSVTLNVDDADASSTNEIQDLTFSTATKALSFTKPGQADQVVDLSSLMDNTDEQQLSYDPLSQNLSLVNGGSVILDIKDADSDDTNEIQSLSLNGSNLLLSDDPNNPTGIDLSPVNTDNQNLSFSGVVGSATGGEIFNLDISGGTGVALKEGANISITQTGISGTELTIEAADALSTVVTDNLTITGDGKTSNPLQVPSGGIKSEHIANGTIIDGDIASVSPQKLLQSGANDGQVLKWSGTQWAPRVIRTDGVTITGDGEATPFSVGVINTGDMASGSVTADKINSNVAGNGLMKSSSGDLAVNGDIVALDADLGTMAAQDAAAVNITGGTLDNVTVTNGTYSGDGSGLTKIIDIAGTAVDPNLNPSTNQVLKWDGSNWIAAKDEIELSDRRTKKEINSLTYGLKDILNLNPVSYKYKKDDSGKRFGFIAQEVQPIIPEVVGNVNEDLLGIVYIDLLPVAIKAIQEQQQIIDQQQKEINALKERLTEVKDAPLDVNSLQLQINILKAQLEQLSTILHAEAKNE